MSDTYTKLFSSITESTVWGESYATRIVWVTMLAMADAQGNVYGSIPGLARRANVTLQEVETALSAFLAPDPYSRTKDEDGRRIEEIDGGWCLINHAKYSAIRGEAERREYKRQWDRDNRASGHKRTKDESDSPTAVRQNPTQSDSSPTKSDSTTPPTPTPTLQEAKSKDSAQHAARFDDFWAAYPKKVGKKPAIAKWQSRKLDAIADRLIADVLNRAANDDGWLRGFVPDPLTYLNQDRWEDDLRMAPVARAGPTVPQQDSKTLTGMKALQGLKPHGLVHQRDYRRSDEVAVLELGSDACRRLGTDHGRDVD